MTQPLHLSEDDRRRISAAVSRAELQSSGEIVTVLAERSDGYGDVALAWSALVALAALVVLAIAPGFYLDLYERISGGWALEWTPRLIFALAAVVAALKFAGTYLVLLWRPLRLRLVPGPLKSARVRERAVRAFRIGAEQRTHGRTGVLIYLSLSEHRAEIVADTAIASKVDPAVWGDAMHAMLAELKQGRVADGMIGAVERVGAILAPHFPRADDDANELPDRLIEV